MSWNVNSVRARVDRLAGVLERHAPDVLCLQELKAPDEEFPVDRVRSAGYQVACFGQPTYNGVAILCRGELTDVQRGLDDGVDDPQCRLLSARVGDTRVVSVYVPNGGSYGTDKWHYKLAWYERLRRWLERTARPDEPLVVCGDFNVAWDERDVNRPDQWAPTVLFHPEARAALASLLSWGLVDTFRKANPEAVAYSWWDYRQLAFPKNDGLRIDYVLATEPLAERCVAAGIDRAERKGKLPSDHAPVWAELRDP